MGESVIKCRFCFSRMYLSLYDYQSKASRYSNGLTNFKTRVTTNQKHTIYSQKPKRRAHKHNTKENHQTTKGKRNKEEIQHQLEHKVQNGNKYISINNHLEC